MKDPLTGEQKRKKTSKELMRIGGTIALRTFTIGRLLQQEAKIEVKDVDNIQEAKTCLSCGVKFSHKASFCSAECMRAIKRKQRQEREK